MLVLKIISQNLAIMLVAATLLWAVCLARKDVSLIDRFWGPACATPGVLTLVQTGHGGIVSALTLTLSWIWALRLAAHITQRNWGKGEDYRYKIMMAGQKFPAGWPAKTLVHVFWTQATLATLIGLPVQLGLIGAPDRPGMFAAIGTAAWLVGIIFESVADLQLKAFKRDPANAGLVMDRGLWSWTRHPNYFGDSMVWFGLFVIALEAPYGAWSVVGPAILLYFLLKVTGVDLLEKSMLERYPAFRSYMERTSSFFPLPPRRRA